MKSPTTRLEETWSRPTSASIIKVAQECTLHLFIINTWSYSISPIWTAVSWELFKKVSFYSIHLSAHGSHIGNVRLEPNQPTPLQIDASFHFGASTRIYTLREKPKQVKSELLLEEDANASLPETEFELDVSQGNF